MSNDQENPLIAERRRKLDGLRECGQAFPNDFRKDSQAASLHAEYGAWENERLEAADIRVAVAGRMMAKRVMGKVSFVRLQDATGSIQLFLARDALPDGLYQAFKTWDVGDIVGAEGTLFRTKTGELSVRADVLRILTKSLRPLPEKFHGLTDQETRYRQRYVDLIMSEESRRVFAQRTRMVAYMRQYLDSRAFCEVETPMMQTLPGGANARPFVTHHNALGLDMYLRIAPELYLKRLVVGGMERVYEINRNFRNEGLSTRHNPEFTMLEVYWAYVGDREMMDLTEDMLRGMAESVAGSTAVEYQGREIDFGPQFERLTMEQALMRQDESLEADRLRDPDYLRQRLSALGVEMGESAGAGVLMTELFEQVVEPELYQPTFITEFPAEVSPLARRNDEDPFVTDRFELFIAGREIANGFSELNDPEEQAARFSAQVEKKSQGDEEAMYFDTDYIRALEYAMPPTGGLGVGVDRLVMLLTDCQSIRDVLLFPHLRPEDPAADGEEGSDGD